MSTLTTKILKEAMNVQDGLLNTIDNLVAEVERLKKENEGLSESVRLLSDEYTRRLDAEEKMTVLEQSLYNAEMNNSSMLSLVEELKEALRKLCPNCESIEELCAPQCCVFCGGFLVHADDCEYIRLCGEGGMDA